MTIKKLLYDEQIYFVPVEEPNHYQLLKITIYVYRAAISLLNLGERNFGWNFNSPRLERLLNRSPTLFFAHPLNLIDVAN